VFPNSDVLVVHKCSLLALRLTFIEGHNGWPLGSMAAWQPLLKLEFAAEPLPNGLQWLSS
jgi:hypothetical protein